MPGATFEQDDFDTIKLLAEKQAMLRQHLRKHLCSLWPALGHGFQNQNKIKGTPNTEEAGTIQMETKPKTLVNWKTWSSQIRHIHSTHPRGELLILIWLLLGSKWVLVKGSQFHNLLCFKSYLSGVRVMENYDVSRSDGISSEIFQ